MNFSPGLNFLTLVTLWPDDRLSEGINQLKADNMGSLNPQWLTIELNSIDATVENWSAALLASYEASLQSLLQDQIIQANQANIVDRYGHLDELAA